MTLLHGPGKDPGQQIGVFVLLPTDFADAKRFYEAFQRRPPLGLQYLQAVLKPLGVESILLDGVLEPLSREKLLAHLSPRPLFVGFYVSSMNRKRVCRAIRIVKQQADLPVIAGGPGSIHAQDLLDAGADVVCMGEGEEVIKDFVGSLQQGRGYTHIKGIAYRENGETRYTEARPLIADLDGIPFPLRDSRTIGKYCDYFNIMVRTPCITLTASRGCYYRCSFCFSHRFWRGRYRVRSPENVIEEIEIANRAFGANYLLFVDDVFPQKHDWIESFVTLWQKKALHLQWMCILNPNSFQRDRRAFFKMIRDIGCNVISFGAQSAVPEILKNVHRRPDEARQLYDAVRTASELGIVTVVTYIFGLPGETELTAATTLRHIMALRPHLMDAHVLEVLPESEIAQLFPSGIVTDVPRERLEQIRKRAFRLFYANLRTLVRLLTLIAFKNPRWVLLFPFKPVWAALTRRTNDI